MNAFVEISEMEMLQVDQILQAIIIESHKAANLTINEFQFDGLASMTFQCLFLYGYGDPTKKARQTTVTETDGFPFIEYFDVGKKIILYKKQSTKAYSITKSISILQISIIKSCHYMGIEHLVKVINVIEYEPFVHKKLLLYVIIDIYR